MMSKVKSSITLLSAGRTTCLPSLWHPAYRQHELYTGIQTELGNLSERCEEKRSSGRTRKSESIDACHRDRATCSSEDGCGNAARAKGWHNQVLYINRNCLKGNLQEV